EADEATDRLGRHPARGRAAAWAPGGSAPLALVCGRTVPLGWPREPRDPEQRGEAYGRDTDTAALAERCPCFRQAAAAAGEAAGRPAARRRAPAGRTQRKTGGRPGSRAGGRWEAACGCAGAGGAGGEGPGRPAGAPADGAPRATRTLDRPGRPGTQGGDPSGRGAEAPDRAGRTAARGARPRETKQEPGCLSTSCPRRPAGIVVQAIEAHYERRT